MCLNLKSSFLYLFLFNYLIFAFDADLDSSEVSRGAGQNAEKSCRICGDRATGLHYGIISCEGEKQLFGAFYSFSFLGCKGFFKRSICNRRVYRCTRDKQCMMSRKQRNRCQYCRLKRCLESGMNRKGWTLTQNKLKNFLIISF